MKNHRSCVPSIRHWGCSSTPGCRLAPAPVKFQKVMNDLLRESPWVKCFLDDLLIGGRTVKEMWDRVFQVLKRLQQAGVRLQLEMCRFGVSELPFLGFIISAEGLKTAPEKVRAVVESKNPHDVKSLRAFFGLGNYYGRFIPKLAEEAAPLNRLLRKDVRWQWKDEQETAIKRLKQLLSSAEVLCAYDPSLSLCLACDASPYGIAAVLSHKFPDGSERQVGYASKTLSSAERNYSQLDKEALAIAYGVKRFHSYLYGRNNNNNNNNVLI